MLTRARLFRHFKAFSRNLAFVSQRNTSGSYQAEHEVPQFCNLNLKCPYNVHIKPLDPLIYTDNNKLKVKVNSDKINLKCDINYNDINIKDETKNVPEYMLCEIELPLKANLFIDCDRNIKVSNFHNEVIELKSDRGDIILEKSQSGRVTVISNRGNITCRELIQAHDITLMTARAGTIYTGRLQGCNLKIETENGDVKVLSSYCDSSIFETQRGKFDLQNPHKNNQIFIHNEGDLNIVGLDGRIQAFVNKGNINVQIARILENSNVTVNEGKVVIKLSDTVQEDTVLEVIASHFTIDKNVNLNMQRTENKYYLLPENFENRKDCTKLLIECPNSNVVLESANWSEVFKLAMRGKKSV